MKTCVCIMSGKTNYKTPNEEIEALVHQEP